MKMTDTCYKIPAWSFLSGSSTCSNVIQLKRKKKANRQMTVFSIYPIYAIKFFSMERSSTKGRQMIKEIIWLACTKCYTTYQIWGQEDFFSRRLMGTVKVFTCLWRKELSTVSLKSPISAYCQYHGL